MPRPGEPCLGGHAVQCSGYDDTLQAFLFKNSWGLGWGLGGYFHLPFEYIFERQYGSDFWTLELVS
jgi:C1A family cysteine protease